MPRFRAKIYKIGLLRCVDVPRAAGRTLGQNGRIAVRGKCDDVSFRSTLIPRGDGAYRLFVHSRVWRPRGLDSGDTIELSIERDEEPREVATPHDLLRALEDRPRAQAEFRAAGPGLRREIAAWLAAAKQAQTRERRIERALDELERRNEKRRSRVAQKNNGTSPQRRGAR